MIYEDDDFVASPPKGFGLLCTWAACRAKSEARDQMTNQPYIKLHIQARIDPLHFKCHRKFAAPIARCSLTDPLCNLCETMH